MRKAENAALREERMRLLAGAYGDVLEIGGGTGVNLAYYPPAVQTLTVIEPERPMIRLVERTARAAAAGQGAVCAGRESAVQRRGFDMVVSTLVLCTVADQPRALPELRRVLRTGGRLLFLEHIRSADPRAARMQDRMNGIGRVVMHGCNCNRSTVETIQAAGFFVADVEHVEIPKVPRFVQPFVTGSADAPAPIQRMATDVSSGG